ncbi:hypothetical protein PR048_027861 [Dryococelus australis]|uniref:Uncharacterized protein n=1 Tax=Dryococelus australis TaxID=614101 RepID=A0ABQ9GHQ3_9NEOP|nr:hypothetical protein PR048_027861 [Dryococelus australis]
MMLLLAMHTLNSIHPYAGAVMLRTVVVLGCGSVGLVEFVLTGFGIRYCCRIFEYHRVFQGLPKVRSASEWASGRLFRSAALDFGRYAPRWVPEKPLTVYLTHDVGRRAKQQATKISGSDSILPHPSHLPRRQDHNLVVFACYTCGDWCEKAKCGNNGNFKPQESFAGFYQASTDVAISCLIQDILLRLQMPLACLHGQTYDGAFPERCSTTYLREATIGAVVYCGAHFVNLVMMDFCYWIGVMKLIHRKSQVNEIVSKYTLLLKTLDELSAQKMEKGKWIIIYISRWDHLLSIKPPIQFTGPASHHVPSSKDDHFRTEYFQVIDTAVCQLKNWFDKPYIKTTP